MCKFTVKVRNADYSETLFQTERVSLLTKSADEQDLRDPQLLFGHADGHAEAWPVSDGRTFWIMNEAGATVAKYGGDISRLLA